VREAPECQSPGVRGRFDLKRRGYSLVMGLGRERNRQCPCESGHKSKDCCLVGGRYFKPEARLVPRPPQTGLMNAECYLACHQDCSATLSREHFISEGVLRELSGGRKQVWVGGLHWLDDGKPGLVPSSSLAAKVLCDRHNIALSPLDAEALRLFRTLRAIIDGTTGQSGHFLFSGHDIERWMLKSMVGLGLSGLARIPSGERARAVTPPVQYLDALRFPGSWPRELPGLSVVSRQAAGMQSQAPVRIELAESPTSSSITGVRITLWNLVLLLGVTPTTLEKRVVYRPPKLVFERAGSIVEVEFSWGDYSPGRADRVVWFDR